jgi:outer membrane protein assembly factor BamA
VETGGGNMTSVWNRLLVFSCLFVAVSSANAGVVCRIDSTDKYASKWEEADNNWLSTIDASGKRKLDSLLRDKWYRRGHLTCEVSTSVDTLLIVKPGRRFKIGKVQISGKDFDGREVVLKRYLPEQGSWFDSGAWETGLSKLLNVVGNLGYPFARWTIRNIEIDSENAVINIKAILSIGSEAVIGEVDSNAENIHATRFLQKACGLKIGARFKESNLLLGRARLMRRTVFKSVENPIVYKTDNSDSIGVWWEVTPQKKPNRFSAILGWQRAEDQDQGKFSGQIDLFLGNIAGSGRQLGVDWSDNGDSRSHLKFSYLEPLLFSWPLDGRLAFEHEIADKEYTTFKTDFTIELPLQARWGLEAGLGFDRGTYQSGQWLTSRRNRTVGAVRHYRIDFYESGWEGLFAVEYASRAVTLQPESTLDIVAVNQTLLRSEVSGELWLSPNFSIGSGCSWSEVKGNSDTVPLSEQYRLGGAKSVRGYNEDQFHGQRVGTASIELRIGKPYRSRLYTFYDIGYFSFTDEELIKADGIIKGFGIGLETFSAMGDVSLAIGFPESFSFETAKLHVSLLQRF